ncbi:vigilin [Nephila pilipes]|uniref:Vigilin n=1 Tax=Nephila pilipes TaxID=299642 RepID=A0A8X6T6J5_NEPPI|nr:vigilin [Nephila pilipes]
MIQDLTKVQVDFTDESIKAESPQKNVEVSIYKQNHKCVIGKGEANIKKIKDETSTKIDLSAEGAETNIIAVRGPKEGVIKAKKLLLEISNEKQLIGCTAEIEANSVHKLLIGKKGASIKKVIEKTGARIVFLSENDDDKNTINIIG